MTITAAINARKNVINARKERAAREERRREKQRRKERRENIRAGVFWACGLAAAAYFYFLHQPDMTEDVKDDERGMTSAHAIVTDKNGRDYDFTEFGTRNLRQSQGHRMDVTLDVTPKSYYMFVFERHKDTEDKHYMLFDFSNIDRVERDGDETKVYLNDGRCFTGEWVSNRTPTEFYRPEELAESPWWAYGEIEEDGKTLERKIDIKEIKSIDVIGNEEDMPSSRKPDMVVELSNGSKYSTWRGHIIDCYGEWWRVKHNTKGLDDIPRTKEKPLEEIAEIEFLGERPSGQSRGFNITYRDGTEERAVLDLDSESYKGLMHTYGKYGEWDKFIIYQDYGALLVPLDDVKKVTFLAPEEKEVPAK